METYSTGFQISLQKTSENYLQTAEDESGTCNLSPAFPNSEKTMQISLIIPVLNEESSIELLIRSILRQTRKPDEVIFVDGGSSDGTIEILEKLVAKDNRYKIIEISKASPGKGRNIGIENAQYEWIALTDAGIELHKRWLEYIIAEYESDPEADLIYGNYSPMAGSFFEKCASLSYVLPLLPDAIRGKSVASLLLRKKVWESVGGFPDLRAAEDLVFMESAEKKGFRAGFAPKALVWWQLRPDLFSTFKKFVLYSKHNVWAGRAWGWHYGIAKQYLLMLIFAVLSFFNIWWLLGIGLWVVARTIKRILIHRYEFGVKTIFDPFYFLTVTVIILVIDLATFIGWAQAILSKKK